MTDIEAHLADGTILKFPDGTPDAVINRTVKEYSAKSKAEAAAPILAAQKAKYPSSQEQGKGGSGIDSSGVGDFLTNALGGANKALGLWHSPVQTLESLPSAIGQSLDPSNSALQALAARERGEKNPDPYGYLPITDAAVRGDFPSVAGEVTGGMAGQALNAVGLGAASGAMSKIAASPLAGELGNKIGESGVHLQGFAEETPSVIHMPASPHGAMYAAIRKSIAPVANVVGKTMMGASRMLGPEQEFSALSFPEQEFPPQEGVSGDTRLPASMDQYRPQPTPAEPIQSQPVNVPRPGPKPSDMDALSGVGGIRQKSQFEQQAKAIQDGINPPTNNLKARASAIQNASRLLKLEPSLADVPAGDAFDQALTNAFREKEMSVLQEQQKVPSGTTVAKKPIIKKWKGLVQDFMAKKDVRSAAAVQRIIDAWNKAPQWSQAPDQIPWKTFVDATNGFLKNSSRSAPMRMVQQVLIDAAASKSEGLANAYADYSIVRRAMEDAKIIVTRDNAGNIIHAQRLKPVKR